MNKLYSLINTCPGCILGPSRIPDTGFGLFTERTYLANSVVAVYGGTKLYGKEATEATGEYMLQIQTQPIEVCVNGANSPVFHKACFIQHARGPLVNCRYDTIYLKKDGESIRQAIQRDHLEQQRRRKRRKRNKQKSKKPQSGGSAIWHLNPNAALDYGNSDSETSNSGEIRLIPYGFEAEPIVIKPQHGGGDDHSSNSESTDSELLEDFVESYCKTDNTSILRPIGVVRATKDIPGGSELFVDYGKSYYPANDQRVKQPCDIWDVMTFELDQFKSQQPAKNN
jgi:hypothetical protein